MFFNINMSFNYVPALFKKLSVVALFVYSFNFLKIQKNWFFILFSVQHID